MLGQMAHDRLEVAFHRRPELGPRFQEVFEVGRREREHLAGPVQTIRRVTLVERCRRRPPAEILELLRSAAG